MKHCDKHWQMTRAAIEARGLTHLVADAKTAHAGIVEDLEASQEGRPSESAYDPLMACFWMVTNRALEIGGLYLMAGDHCPICEAVKHTASIPLAGQTEPAGEQWVESHWIDGPADAALEECRQRGLVSVS